MMTAPSTTTGSKDKPRSENDPQETTETSTTGEEVVQNNGNTPYRDSGKPETDENRNNDETSEDGMGGRRAKTEEEEYNDAVATAINPCWTRLTERFIHHWIPRIVTSMALIAARRPYTCIAVVVILSFGLAAAGYLTNFTLNVEEFAVFAPFGAPSMDHRYWIMENFEQDKMPFAQIIHRQGEDVLGVEGMRRVFEAYQVLRETPGYDDLCGTSTANHSCYASSPVRFWNFSRELFEQTVSSDDDVIETLSKTTYPDGTPVDTEAILGHHQRSNVTSLLIGAQAYNNMFLMPHVEGLTTEFETQALERNLPLRDEWNSEEASEQKFWLEVQSERSYSDEFQRAIVRDLPLIPLVFLVMTVFTCILFFRWDKVHSRVVLGFGCVCTIVCSLLSGYGVMFLFGVPFTNMTQLVPFVIFGVGLDDNYVIKGAFDRTDPRKSFEERIRETMMDVGVSISLTTLTTVVAFASGSFSNIPAVRWLCWYSLTTIVIDFAYQATFFIALLTLDERRVQQKRRDCCVCFAVKERDAIASNDDNPSHDDERTSDTSFVDRFMEWYADFLLLPQVKTLVLVSFTVFFGACVYSASKFRQEFEITELVPDGSYINGFIYAYEEYNSRSPPIYAYFRNVDQSNTEIQQEMINYMDDLVALDEFGETTFCWVQDFQTYLRGDQAAALIGNATTFQQQIQLLLSTPMVKELYGSHIVLNEKGEIVASRCVLYAENLNLDVVQDQIDLLYAQRKVGAEQPANQGKKEAAWSFFTYHSLYLTWEFYGIVESELMFNTISGIIAVTIVGFICMPHWTATFFVLPMMIVLYVDLIGVIQFAGLYINVVTYVCAVLSIGLLIDFLIHVLLRFYETPGDSREDRVKKTIRTMGAAVLSGGLSTFLGVLPLAFSTSAVMRTVFICFVATVAIGCGHGLIFVPVVLSLVGPERRRDKDETGVEELVA